jgi:hypothetical protein
LAIFFGGLQIGRFNRPLPSNVLHYRAFALTIVKNRLREVKLMTDQDTTLTIRIDAHLKESLATVSGGRVAQVLRALGQRFLGWPLGHRGEDIMGGVMADLEEEVSRFEARLWVPGGCLTDEEWVRVAHHLNTAKAVTTPLMEKGPSINQFRGINLVGRLQLMLHDKGVRDETIYLRRLMAQNQHQQQSRNALPPLD